MQDKTFIFERYEFRPESHTLHMHYAYEGGAVFEEKIIFMPATRALSAPDLAAFDAVCRLIFLLAGVSYYKAYVPRQLKCAAFALDKETAEFVEKVYRNGLGEFAYQNKLDLGDRVRFISEGTSFPKPQALNLPHRLLVPVGGGKDSIVTIECLKGAGEPLSLFVLGSPAGIAEPILATAEVSGLPLIRVGRALSPKLLELNKLDALNGHVPITAILSSIAIACAILYGFDNVVLSNEHSASAPNLRMGDIEVNHQYSKSFAFEADFAAYVAKRIAPDISYFSLLRPFSEIEIARRFARLTPYHSVFRSCNKAFRQDIGARPKNWCCDCPKCRFVFMALAPFMEKEKLVAIFGKDLLADPAQREGFAELCGLAAYKPFECVGEIEESALVMEKLYRSPEWKDDMVVKELGGRLSSGDFEKNYGALFAAKPGHNVPEKYLRMLDACR